MPYPQITQIPQIEDPDAGNGTFLLSMKSVRSVARSDSVDPSALAKMLKYNRGANSANLPQKSRPVILPVVDASDVRFTHVSFGKGPSHSRVHHIVQDEQGFLWFAGFDRLERYDGYNVREYPPDPRYPNGPDNVHPVANQRPIR